MRATRRSAAGVSRRPRPDLRSSSTPASRSSCARCCETAEGLYDGGLGDGGDRSAQVQLAEEAQLLEVQHPEPPIMKDH